MASIEKLDSMKRELTWIVRENAGISEFADIYFAGDFYPLITKKIEEIRYNSDLTPAQIANILNRSFAVLARRCLESMVSDELLELWEDQTKPTRIGGLS